MEGVKLMFVECWRALLRLDLKDYDFDLSFSSEEPPPTAPVEKRYSEMKFPTSFGFFKWGSDMYFLGGREASREVLELDSSFKETRYSLESAKTEGKIYVLRRAPISDESLLECFDISSEVSDSKVLNLPSSFFKKMKNLPFSSSDDDEVEGHFVLGHKVYFFTESCNLFCFDTKESCWFREKNMFKYCDDFGHDTLSCFPWLVPVGGRNVGADVILSFQQDRQYDPYPALGYNIELFAHLYSSDGCLLAYQKLPNVFCVKLFSPVHCLIGHCLIPMEDGKFCAIMVGCTPEIGALCGLLSAGFEMPLMALALSFFKATKLPNAYVLEAKAKNRPLIRDACPGTIPLMEVEDRFLELEIEKQYIFMTENSETFIPLGAIFA